MEEYLEKYLNNLSNNIDDTIANFLNDNGYKVEKPYNLRELNKIKKQLKEKGLFIDYIIKHKIINNNNSIIEKSFIIPFFNSIKKPKTQTEKEKIFNDYINDYFKESDK